MKSEDELRRERRLAWIVVAILVPISAAFYITVKFVTPNHLVPSRGGARGSLCWTS